MSVSMGQRDQPAAAAPARLHILMNGVFKTTIAGGDLHCFELARAALEAGYRVQFWGGHALKEVLADQRLAADLTLTDRAKWEKTETGALPGQFRLLADDTFRFFRTLRLQGAIRPEDIVYASSDYWFDVLPAVWCAARRKLMVWHMQAPSLSQVIWRSRPDVDPARLASLHYSLSQGLSLRAFRRCRNKRLFHVHPAMRPILLALGYRETEIKYMSFGMEAQLPPGSEPSGPGYDLCWIGRVHRQKGIEDLLATLQFLAKNLPDFRAVFIGNLKKDLEARIRELGLTDCVTFSGFVSETEKFRLFRSSRVFPMTSRFEGSPRVVGEALLCNLPVIAYDIPTYRPLFGDLVHYVPCFDLAAFQQATLEHLRRARAGVVAPPRGDLKRFIEENSWQTLRRRFLETLAGWE